MKQSFPWGICIGEFIKQNLSVSIPVVVDSKQGGFIVAFDNKSISEVNDFIENIIISIIQSIDYNLIEVHLFDYTHQKRFPAISELKNLGLYKTYLNSLQAETAFNQLEEESQERHQNRLSNQRKTLFDYNKESSRKLSYHVLVINLNHYPDDRFSLSRLKNFLHSAFIAGFYVISFINIEEVPENSNVYQTFTAKDFFLEKFPMLTILDKKVSFTKELFKFYYLQEQDFIFNALKVDKVSEITAIKSKLSTTENADLGINFLKIPIAESADSSDYIYFELGNVYRNFHAIITGGTGSGKSTLLNNIITSIAEKYTAKEIRLDLMDFKQGVEFQAFASHPNVEHLFLQNSDKQAAIDLLKKFVNQGKDIAALFREKGVRDIGEYNDNFPDRPIPYRLLIIDEVQNLYEGMDYRQQEELNNLLDKLLREGRSWGNHLVISTQTLNGTKLPINAITAGARLRITFALNTDNDAAKTLSPNNTRAPLSLGLYEILLNRDGGNDPSKNIIGIALPPKDIELTLKSSVLNRGKDEITNPIIVESQESNLREHATEQINIKKTLLQSNTVLNQHENNKLNQVYNRFLFGEDLKQDQDNDEIEFDDKIFGVKIGMEEIELDSNK